MYSDHRPVFGYYYFKTNYLPPSSSSSQKLIPYSKSLLSAEQHLKQFRSQSPSQSIEAFRKSQDIPSLRSSTSSLLTGSSSLPSTPISLPINTPSLSNLISRPPPPVPIQRVTNEPGNSLIDFSDSAALPVPPTIAVEDSTAEAAESFSAPSIDRWWE